LSGDGSGVSTAFHRFLGLFSVAAPT